MRQERQPGRIKEQVVETTCESHEKTSKSNFFRIPGKLPARKIYFPGKELIILSAKDKKHTLKRIEKLTQPRK